MAAEFLHRMGERIRLRREELDMSRADLARSMPGKVSENQIYRWETGRHQPHPDTLETIARLLGKDVSYFMAPTPMVAATPDLTTNGRNGDASRTAGDDEFAAIARRLAHQEQLLAEVSRQVAEIRMMLKTVLKQQAAEELPDDETPAGTPDAAYALETLRELEELRAKTGRDIGRRTVQQQHAKDHLRAQAAGES